MTGSSLWTLLLLAVTAAASPFSLIAFSIVLATDRGPRNGIAFICGWVVTVTLIGVGVALIGSSVDIKESNTAGKWTLALELALGAALIIMWARRRFRPHPKPVVAVESTPQPVPSWQKHMTTMGYPGAFIAGGAVQTWPVMIAAASEILRLDIGAGESLAWMIAFALATTTGIVILEVLAWRSPDSAAARLDHIRTYVHDHRDSVINWLYLVVGLWLIFRAIIGFA